MKLMNRLLIFTFFVVIAGLIGLTVTASLNKPATFVADVPYERAGHSSDEKQDYAERLSQAIQYQTISSKEASDTDQKPFAEFNDFLFKSFSGALSKLTLEYSSEYSLLFSLKGKQPSLAPMLLIAHSDVVPAQNHRADTTSGWQYPPFSGHIDDQYVWGRGALDNKSAILAIFEALEKRARSNAEDSHRTIYIAVTHDEEVGGYRGAKKIANYLKDNNIRPYFILDEGQAVTQGVIPNVEKPVALIGVSQKGYMTVELSAKGEPGHSMMPPEATAISSISHAINLLTNSPMSPKMTGPVKSMFRELSHEMGFPTNVALFHNWLSEPLLIAQLEKNPATNALIRSSMSVNVISGGIADNILPKQVTSLLNYRIAPHNTSDEILAHIRKAIDGTGVEMKVVSAIEEAAPITDHKGDAYQIVEQAITDIFPDVIVAPSITLSTTDSRHFADLSPNILRFCPILLNKRDLNRFHGVDERISRENYIQMIDFYGRLIDKI